MVNHNLANVFPHRQIFLLFSLINFLNYLDRGIIPGASQEFNIFIQQALTTNKPNVYLGILQSSFIVGFSISSLIFAYISQFSPPMLLVTKGMCVWICAVVGCGLCGNGTGRASYAFLVFFRMLSGVGEASFCCIIPPIIQSKGGENSASWLAAFYTAIPVGTAVGFAYSSVLANSSLGWQAAFYIEGMMMAPFVGLLFLCHRYYYGSILSTPSGYDDIKSAHPSDALLVQEQLDTTERQNVYKNLKVIVSTPTFSLTVLGYSAYAAVLVGLSTFGPAFLVDLGFFHFESSASAVFGGIASLAGLIGTPLGGLLLDKFHVSTRGGLRVCCLQNLMWVLVATLLVLPVPYVSNLLAFCLLLFFGCTALFSATAGFNLAVMMAVPPKLRALALACNTIGIHAFGDVPSPVIVGALKDTLAPSCVGEFTEDCARERPQIQLTMLIILLYLWVSVIFLGVAFGFEHRKQRHRFVV